MGRLNPDIYIKKKNYIFKLNHLEFDFFIADINARDILYNFITAEGDHWYGYYLDSCAEKLERFVIAEWNCFNFHFWKNQV